MRYEFAQPNQGWFRARLEPGAGRSRANHRPRPLCIAASSWRWSTTSKPPSPGTSESLQDRRRPGMPARIVPHGAPRTGQRTPHDRRPRRGIPRGTSGPTSSRRSATRPAPSPRSSTRRLWPRTWQVACREEELAAPGDFVEYRIADQSILVVRAGADEIRAYYNSCRHRGTRLAHGCGSRGRRPDHLSVPRVAVEPRRLVRVRARPRRVRSHVARHARPAARRAALRTALGLRVDLRRSRRRARLDEHLSPLQQYFDPLSPRRHAVPLVPHDGAAGELEGRARRLPRGVPQLRHAPAAAAVVRRHRHALRAVPQRPRPLRHRARGGTVEALRVVARRVGRP